MFLLGIDEAGRGPVIGPMVIVGFLIENKKITNLLEIGVTDSKLLSPEERVNIYNELKKIADNILIKKIYPSEIDKYVYRKRLNYLELEVMSEIINSLNPDIVFIDSPSRNTQKVHDIIKNLLNNKEIKIICKNKADFIYPVVSAASIVAKVERDNEIKKIENEVGFPIGSGYPSDPRTKKVIKENYIALWKYIRKSWKTVRNTQQKTLDSYFK